MATESTFNIRARFAGSEFGEWHPADKTFGHHVDILLAAALELCETVIIETDDGRRAVCHPDGGIDFGKAEA